jgi:phosphatidylglycerophosphate synthase
VGAAVFELNLPNVLTVFRILLVPVLVAALLSEGPQGDLLAAIVFAVASFTDALDGWIARRRKSESTFGKLMDPLADKLLVTSALVSLVSLDRGCCRARITSSACAGCCAQAPPSSQSRSETWRAECSPDASS